MDTDQLIRTLAADNSHHARPVGFVLALALLAAAPVSLLMFVTELGVRPDVMSAMHNPFFDLKFAITLARRSRLPCICRARKPRFVDGCGC